MTRRREMLVAFLALVVSACQHGPATPGLVGRAAGRAETCARLARVPPYQVAGCTIVVHGMVQRTGRQPFRPGMRVGDALAYAGGASIFADHATVRRGCRGFRVNLRGMAHRGEAGPPLAPGDELYVAGNPY